MSFIPQPSPLLSISPRLLGPLILCRPLAPTLQKPLFPPFPFLSPTWRVPYSELSIETSGDVRARLECKEIPEAHLVVVDLPKLRKDEVDVVAKGKDCQDYQRRWAVLVADEVVGECEGEGDELVHGEQRAHHVIVLKFVAGKMWWENVDARPRNVRSIEITGPDE